jgi:hypothetical protein
MLQVGDNIRRIHNHDARIDESRYLDASVYLLQGLMIGFEQTIERLELEALEFEDHSNLARKWAEGAVVELDHDRLILARGVDHDSMSWRP